MESTSIRISKKASIKLKNYAEKSGRIIRDLADKAITYVIDNDLFDIIYKEATNTKRLIIFMSTIIFFSSNCYCQSIDISKTLLTNEEIMHRVGNYHIVHGHILIVSGLSMLGASALLTSSCIPKERNIGISFVIGGPGLFIAGIYEKLAGQRMKCYNKKCIDF